MTHLKKINFPALLALLALVHLTMVFPLAGAPRKIKIKKGSGKEKTTPLVPQVPPTTYGVKKIRAEDLPEKKDLWLAVGLGLSVSGAGHFYLQQPLAGSIYMAGTYGFMGAGVALILSASSSKTTRLDGNIARQEVEINQPLFLLGSLSLASGVIFFLGNIISIFNTTEDFNERVERLHRYYKKQQRAAQKTSWRPRLKLQNDSRLAFQKGSGHWHRQSGQRLTWQWSAPVF